MTLAKIAPTLAKLVPMLASDQDGEVMATVRAIDRTLKSAGADWHMLATAISGGGATEPEHGAAPTWGSIGVEARLRWLQTLACGPDLLTPFEDNFVSDFAARISDWPYFSPSRKQEEVFNKILLKGWQRGVRP